MNRKIILLAMSAMLPIAACSSGSTPPAATSEASVPPPPAVAAADQSFATMAAAGNLAEIQTAQLVESKTRRPAIKHFAERIVKDHTAANQQLMQIAQQKGITLPTTPTETQQQDYARLQGESGHMFDHDYLTSEVQDHQQMLQAFQMESQSGTDPDLKAFATQTIPVLQQHLAIAQRLSGSGMSHHYRHHHVASSAS